MEKGALSNKLGNLIEMERDKRQLLHGGNKILLDEVLKDIANYCNINHETVKAYKLGRVLPSLPVALKISEYFHVTVNDIFTLENYELATKNLSNKGRPPKPEVSKLCVHCGSPTVARGLCMKHYQQERRSKD